MISALSLNDLDSPQSTTTVSQILLRENADVLRQAVTSRPSGILVTGYDRFTRRDVIKAAFPAVQILSACQFLSGEPTADIACPPAGVVCVEDLDVNEDGESIEGKLKGFFSRRTEQSTIIGSASLQSSIPQSLLRAGRFERIEQIQAPPAEARTEAWQLILNTLARGNDQWRFSCAEQLSQMSPGYVLRDFTHILYNFLSATPGKDVHDKESGTLLDQGKALEYLTATHKPMSASADLDFIASSVSHGHAKGEALRLTWDGCGGYADIKQALTRLFEWPIRHLQTFQTLGVDPPRGVLLHGPHGCGKTKLALAFLHRLRHANHLHVNAPDLFSKFLGDSEARVRALFERARSLVPCVVFIDELDAIGGERQGSDGEAGGSGVERRVLGSLLTELDGVSGGNVFVLACASSLDVIDPALVRPGRLDHVLHVARPSIDDRKDILSLLLRDVPFVPSEDGDGEREDAMRNAVVKEIAERTEGKTGAALTALCREAAMIAIEGEADAQCLTIEHFQKALISGLIN